MRKLGLVVLALVVLSPLAVLADEDDPEPPAGGWPELHKLRGKWTVTRMRDKGREVNEGSPVSYAFDGDKLTYETPKDKYVVKVKIDAKNKVHVLEMTREDTKTTSKLAFKIDGDELFLA